jgi:hypothetical protein
MKNFKVAICDLKIKLYFYNFNNAIMSDSKQLSVIPDEAVINKIYFIRNEKVMLDSDLVELYELKQKG